MSVSSPVRTVLFLQGPPSCFWVELADAFERSGHRVRRVNLCGGDLVFWRRRGAVSYRGSLEKWPAWLEAFCRREGVTDILYYADRLPYHVRAQEVAARLGLKAYALEFGYLRPDWLTLERDGMSAFSHFPEDPDVIRAAAADLHPFASDETYPVPFHVEAQNEVAFGLALEFLRPLYPFYRSDRYYHPFLDYLSWLKKLLTSRHAGEKALALSEKIWAEERTYFLLALQLQSDYQIRDNAPYRHLSEMLEEVIGSFAREAARESLLLIKMHPLDNGYENWEKRIAALIRKHSVEGRVLTLDGGHLSRLIERAAGVVVVNSTVGLHAIRAGTPVKVLGLAVFDIAGLTHQGPLDSFWQMPEPVDAALADALVRLMEATIQVKGSFYHPAGRALAIPEIVRRIAEERVNLPGAYCDPPPRLAKAKEK